MFKRKTMIASLLSVMAVGVSGAAIAADSTKAAMLDTDKLTPVGAERAGNADGSIPAWSGKWLGVPDHVQYSGTGSHHPDPYADEKPLFEITAANVDQYRNRLSPGQLALFEKYPDTFRMPVYPSHRDFRLSDEAHKNFKLNAERAQLVDGGDGVQGAFGASPFPVPENGYELFWNHNLRITPWTEVGDFRMALVHPNGTKSLESNHYYLLSPWMQPGGKLEDFNQVQMHYMITTNEPTRKKGEIIVGHEFTDNKAHPRQNWQYVPGTRRVRRAPNVAYDTPFGAGGFRTMDEDRLFNGSPDRYDWKMVGKKEVYIPYNTYQLNDPSIKYDDLLTVNHLNPDHMRYELHRVWVLEATLKEGNRHVYGKRVLYLDEDSWAAVMADSYDARGQLWRVNMLNQLYAYETKGFYSGVVVYHDLISGSYLADRLVNEGKAPELNAGGLEEKFFSASSLRKLGR